MADFTEKLQKQIGENGVQLVTIGRPSAHREYEPYEIKESKEKFLERVLSLQNGTMMEKSVLSSNFTIEDIYILFNISSSVSVNYENIIYEITKHLTDEERMDYYNKAGRVFQREIEEARGQAAIQNREAKKSVLRF